MKEHRDYRHLANMLREKYPEYIVMTDIPHEAYMAAQAIDELMDYIQSIEATPPAQPAPVQEPCGWQFYQDDKWHNGMDRNDHRANTEAAGVPVRNVYPEPQPAAWVGLTDEDIAKAGNVKRMLPYAYARAIEAKLREKNGGAA